MCGVALFFSALIRAEKPQYFGPRTVPASWRCEPLRPRM